MRNIKFIIAAILAIGIVRFVLSVSGIPDSTVKFVSMSVIIFAGAIYLALTTQNWKQRLKASYLLILPYMIIEASALGYTLATGRRTIFHAPEYSFGYSVPMHFFGHIVGGLTWEPLGMFVLMQIVAFIPYAGRRILKAFTVGTIGSGSQ